MHYYKFNIADWSLSTAHLSLKEEAVYFRLINFYHDSEKPIPLENKPALRRLRLSGESETVSIILTEFFEETDKGWVHSRCEKDLKDYRKTAKKNKANGAKGGRPSKDGACSVTQDKPSGLPDESQNNPNHKPLTTNQEPLTKYIPFDSFWDIWPKKVSRTPAEKSWAKAKITEETFLLITNHLKLAYAATEKQYIPNPTTYINQERWNDEVIPNGQTNQGPGHSAPSTAKLTPAQRTRNARLRWEAEQGGDVSALGSHAGDLRAPVEQSVRGGADGSVGEVLDGDFTRTDS